MPKFKIPMFREVIVSDTVEREYDAPNMDTALEMARADAERFNTSCPDDANCGAEVIECRTWQVDEDSAEEAPRKCEHCGEDLGGFHRVGGPCVNCNGIDEGPRT